MPDPKKKAPVAPVVPTAVAAPHPADIETEHEIELQKLDAMKKMIPEMQKMGNAAEFVNYFLKAIKGDKGDEGKPGKDADETKIIDGIMELVKERIPTPEDIAEIVLPRMEKPKDGKMGARGPKGDKGDAPKMSDIVDLLLTDKNFLAQAKGPKGDTPEAIPGKPGKDGSPDTAEQIVEKINAGDAQIDASKIKGIFRNKDGEHKGGGAGYLRELADVEIIGEPSGTLVLTWDPTKHKWVAQATQAITPVAYDISSQFDGVATTFTIPAYSAILLFNITGWPPNGSLRPTVDFTTPSNTTVALTSEVSAPMAGASGIILIIPA